MKGWQWLLAASLIFTFAALSFLSARYESLTYDEIVYIEEGKAALGPHTFSIDPYNPPLIQELTGLPSFFGFQDPLAGRSVTIALGVLLAIAVFWVTKSISSFPYALFALFLLVFEPNMVGNSHYITLDTGFTLFFFLSYIVILHLFRIPSIKHALLAGFTLGLMLGSKISGLTYMVFSTLFLFVLTLRRHTQALRRTYIIVLLVSAALVLWCIYFFQSDVIVVKHDDPKRLSSRIIAYANTHNIPAIARGIQMLQNQKIPLGTYLSVVKNNVIRSRQAGSTFFLGMSYPFPRWYFMIVNVLLKTPLPLLILFSFSCMMIFRHDSLQKKVLPFLFPIIGVLIVASISRMNPWVRYVLPVYPFVVIIASFSLKELRGVGRHLILIFLILWYVVGTLSQFPHFISYANEFAGPRERRYEKFIDSNIDWGQGLMSLQKYISVKQPHTLLLSYFGRDNADFYGFYSQMPWGSYKFEEICAFHTINYPQHKGYPLTAISVSNWYGCGYAKDKKFDKSNVIDIAGDSILIFKN